MRVIRTTAAHLGDDTSSVNAEWGAGAGGLRAFHHGLSCQAGAYQNSTSVIAVAKAGDEDGDHLVGGTPIVTPEGEIVAEVEGEADGYVVHNLDATIFGERTSFDVARHRRTEHHGLTASRAGGEPPPARTLEEPAEAAAA